MRRGRHPSRASQARVLKLPREWVTEGVPEPVVAAGKAVYWRFGARADAAAQAVGEVWRGFNRRCQGDDGAPTVRMTNEDEVTTTSRFDFTLWTRSSPARLEPFSGAWPALRSFVT